MAPVLPCPCLNPADLGCDVLISAIMPGTWIQFKVPGTDSCSYGDFGNRMTSTLLCEVHHEVHNNLALIHMWHESNVHQAGKLALRPAIRSLDQ